MSILTRRYVSIVEVVGNVIFWAAFALLDEKSPVYNLTKQMMLAGREITARQYANLGVNELDLAKGEVRLRLTIGSDGYEVAVKVELIDNTVDGHMADTIAKIKMEWLAYGIVDEEGNAY